MWACGWSEKSQRCVRFHCGSAGPCQGYAGDPIPKGIGGVDRAITDKAWSAIGYRVSYNDTDDEK